jgi:carboxylesterase type B
LTIDVKLAQLRAIPGQIILETMMKLKTPTFRAVLDNAIISKDIFQWIYSGELARRFKSRGMKLLIGEVEHEEVMYAIGAPNTTEGLLPSLFNYYRSSVAKALVDHYTGSHPDVERMYTGIVTDVQVRATTRAFSKALVDGGVPIKDVLRYRISLPIRAEDEQLPAAHADRFRGKVPHAFDFLHWW